MPLYRCEWPNGDVSFVLADDVQDAIVKLDEWGEATPKMLRKVTQFLIDLSPQRDVLAQRAKLAWLEQKGWRLLFVRGEANAADFLAGLLPCVEQYSGFNLLLGDRHGLFFLNSERGEVERLQPGLYGLSNADLDTPWPKVLRASSSLAAALDAAEPAQLLELLADRQQPPRVLLPDTGVGLDWEMLLATIFIVGPGYGTRASTALVLQRDGGLQLLERSFGRSGEPIGEVRLALP